MRSTTSWVALAGVATLLGALAVAGCGGPQAPCQADTECPPASQCDTEAKVCVQRTEDTSCSPACADWQFCSQGSCYDRYQGITVLEPAAGIVDGGAVVRAQLQPIAPWIAARQHAGLAYSVSEGATPVNSGGLAPEGDGGIYRGRLGVGSEGSYTLRAGFPGFPGFPAGAPVSGDVAITVDVTAPMFDVDAGTKSGLRTGAGEPDDRDPLLADAFKRNDVVTVSIGSDDTDLNLDSVALSVQGVDAGTQTAFSVSAGSGCGFDHCWTATVDLATVEMWALRGRMTVTVSGRDNAGNLGQRAIQIPVTRFKWSRAMPGVTSIQASPAVGVNGTIYVGTTTGTLTAIKPDGTDQWSMPASLPAALLASPAAGKGSGSEEVVYASPSNNPPSLYAFLGADGGMAMSPITAPISGSPEASPLVAATTVFSDVRESATTYLNGMGASLGTLRYGSATGLFGVGDGGSVAFPGNIVGEDNGAFAADDSFRIREYSFNASGWSETVTSRATIDAPKGLLLSPTFVAAATATTVVAFPRSTGSMFSRAASNPSIPIFANSDLVYSESNGAVTRITPGSSSPVTGTVGGATTSPLLANGAVYFLRTTNSLHALDSALGTLWAEAVEGSVTIASSPNIDCARAPDGSKLPGPGTLYYGANNGKLYAIIVDNPGIDTTSPWPKYQHDPRNTGSLSTPLSEFACP